jgi:hypothetical protein
MEADFGDKLRVIYRENPLYPNHQYSIVAAQAAEAAGLQGEDKFWAMHDKLFENQTTWAEAKDKDAAVAIFVDYAKQVGSQSRSIHARVEWRSSGGAHFSGRQTLACDGSPVDAQLFRQR